MLIPKIIHQTFEDESFLLPEYIENSQRILAMNPDWSLNLYSSRDREDFIRSKFDSKILESYLSIDSRYGASRADFFRYLIIYSEGGLYLDIKATAVKPLNTVIYDDDTFITANWPDRIDGVDLSQIGIHKEIEFAEYQNWFILSQDKHFVLERVIEEILKNLHQYRPLKHGVGKLGVLRTTGPIAYSKAIHEFVLNNSVRLATNADLGLRPTIHTIRDSKNPFPNKHKSKHYSELLIPIVRKSALHSITYSCLLILWHKFKRLTRVKKS